MISHKNTTEESVIFQFPTIFNYSNGQRYAKLQNECGQSYSKNKAFINNGDTFNGKYIIDYFQKTQNMKEFIDKNKSYSHNNTLKKIDDTMLTENINIISGVEFLTKKQYEEFLDQSSNVKKINYLKRNSNEFAMFSKSHLMPNKHSRIRIKRKKCYFKIMTSLINEQLNETKHLKNCEIIKKQEIPFKLMQCGIVIFDITNNSEYELHQARISFNYIFNELIKYNDKDILECKKNGIIRKFVLISTAMTWVKENNNCQTYSEDEEQGADFGVTQKSILERLSLIKYQNIFEFEKFILKSNSSKIKDIFKTYIIGTGIIYGQEENAFHYVFKSALINPKEMYISKINHRVPMFHIDELVKLVFIISKYDNRVRGNYVLAIEQESYGFNNIIKSLCNETCGSHLVLKEDHLIMKQYKFNDFTWDLICSDLNIDPMFDIIVPGYQIQRTSIISDMKESIIEFLEATNIYSLKLIVSGQEKHVVTDIAKRLALYYQVQMVNIPSLINNYLTMLRNNQNELKLKINDMYEKRKNISHELINFTDQPKDESLEHTNEAFIENNIDEDNQTFTVAESSKVNLKTNNMEMKYTDYFQENSNKQYIQSKKDLFEVEKDITNIKHMIENLNDKYEQYENNMSKNQGWLDNVFLLPLIIESLSSFSCRNQGYVLDIFPLSYEQVEFIFIKVIKQPNFIVLLSLNTNVPKTIEKTCSSIQYIHTTHEYQIKNIQNNTTISKNEEKITTTNYMRDYFKNKNVKILMLDVPLELATGTMIDLQYNRYMNSIINQIGHTPSEFDLKETIINVKKKAPIKTLNKSKTIPNVSIKTALNKLNRMKELWDNDIITTRNSKKKQEQYSELNIHAYLRTNVLPTLTKEICLIDNAEVPISQFPENSLNKTKLCGTQSIT